MDYYERKRRLALDLKQWLNNKDDPLPFNTLAQDLLIRYGFTRLTVEKTLRNEFGVEWDETTKDLRKVA